MTERLAQIEIAVVARWPSTVRLWRQTVGTFHDYAGNWIKVGIPGMADLSGIGPGGVRLEIEVKDPERPHRDRKVIERQRRWRKMIVDMGGICIQVSTPEEAIEQLEKAFAERKPSGMSGPVIKTDNTPTDEGK